MFYSPFRCGLYDAEIRKLDAARSSAKLDFRQLFLVRKYLCECLYSYLYLGFYFTFSVQVKESMALMYQMLQLPGEALVQYEEMEAVLSFAPKSMQKVLHLQSLFYSHISTSIR